MKPTNCWSFFSLRSVSLLLLPFMSFYSKHLGTAFSYQLKNASAVRGFRRHSILQRSSTSAADCMIDRKTDVKSLHYTKTVIANFVESLPPLAALEVIRILEASIEQHKVLPNVIRLKIPVTSHQSVTSVSTGLDGTSKEISSDTEDTSAIQYGNFSICGDTHGQFFDVMNIFSERIGNFPSHNNAYLFNGDFVDRGLYSIEVILTLLAIKLSDPTAMNLLRGNHETILMNDMFGFTKEVKIFVTHGGIGPSIVQMSIADLDKLDRFKEPTFDDDDSEMVGEEKVKEFCPPGMSELLWSDPMESRGFKRSQRGGGVTTFGEDVTAYFLDRNDLKFMVRSHQVMTDGFEFSHQGRCVTIFSAPDYCGGKNNGALIRFNNAETMHTPSVIGFPSVKHFDMERKIASK